jgi:CheY-like chemotaxis protein
MTTYTRPDRAGTPGSGPSGRRPRGPTSGRYRPLVLLVEDDPNDREIYGKTLWYNGFDVIQGESGEEAVALAREHAPDVILVDLLLPGMNGIEACRRIKEDPATAGVPVLALTARSEREFGLLARDAGCAGFLEKPIGPLDVLHVVEDMVGRPPPAGQEVEAGPA